MTEEQKKITRDKVNAAAATAARKTAEIAKAAAGWKKWLWVALTALLALLAGLTQVGCENITPEQVQTAHRLYHVVTGQPCIVAVEGGK